MTPTPFAYKQTIQSMEVPNGIRQMQTLLVIQMHPEMPAKMHALTPRAIPLQRCCRQSELHRHTPGCDVILAAVLTSGEPEYNPVPPAMQGLQEHDRGSADKSHRIHNGCRQNAHQTIKKAHQDNSACQGNSSMPKECRSGYQDRRQYRSAGVVFSRSSQGKIMTNQNRDRWVKARSMHQAKVKASGKASSQPNS